MAEQERERLEARFFGDSALFDELLAAEDDLVDEFVLDRLPAADRQRFEEYYLASPERAEKVAAARQFRAWMATQKKAADTAALPWWERLAASMRMPVWAMGAAAAVLLVSAAGWVILTRPLHPVAPLPEVAQRTPEPQPPPPRPVAPEQLPPPASTPPKPAAALFAFTLLPGALRGGAGGDADLTRVVLPKDAAAARMTLRLEKAPDLATYRVAIETVEGQVVWQGAAARVGSGSELHATVPLGGLAAGDYLVRVTGSDGAGGSPESVADYAVRIARQ